MAADDRAERICAACAADCPGRALQGYRKLTVAPRLAVGDLQQGTPDPAPVGRAEWRQLEVEALPCAGEVLLHLLLYMGNAAYVALHRRERHAQAFETFRPTKGRGDHSAVLGHSHAERAKAALEGIVVVHRCAPVS